MVPRFYLSVPLQLQGPWPPQTEIRAILGQDGTATVTITLPQTHLRGVHRTVTPPMIQPVLVALVAVLAGMVTSVEVPTPTTPAPAPPVVEAAYGRELWVTKNRLALKANHLHRIHTGLIHHAKTTTEIAENARRQVRPTYVLD